MSLGDGITWADWVRMVAAEHGIHGLSGADVEWLLWERTAWPVCLDIDILRGQLDEALAARTRNGPPEGGPSLTDRVTPGAADQA